MGKLGLVLMGRAMLSKSLIQFSVEGWGCVPSLLLDYGGGDEDNVTSFGRSHAGSDALSAPTCSRPPPTHASARDSWTGHRQCRICRFNSWIRKMPWRKKWQPSPVFLPEKSHGHRSLAGYTVHAVAKESDMISRLNENNNDASQGPLDFTIQDVQL